MSEIHPDTPNAQRVVELTLTQRLALTGGSLLALVAGLVLWNSAAEPERPHLGAEAPNEEPAGSTFSNQQLSEALGAATHDSLANGAAIDVLVGRCIQLETLTSAGQPITSVVLNPVVTTFQQEPKDQVRVLGGVTPNRLPDKNGNLEHSVYPFLQTNGELQFGELGTMAVSTRPHLETVVLSRENPQRLRSNNDLQGATDAPQGGIVYLSANIPGEGPASQQPPGHVMIFDEASGHSAADYCITS